MRSESYLYSKSERFLLITLFLVSASSMDPQRCCPADVPAWPVPSRREETQKVVALVILPLSVHENWF